MKPILNATLVFLFLFPVLLFAQLSGKVLRISDGDTFVLVNEQNTEVRIRLFGIDCPEKGQAYSKECKQFLRKLISGKKLQLEEKDTDRYGRTVAIVFADTININETMLAQGMAWQYTKYDSSKKWAALQTAAKDSTKGIWSQPNPIAPWEWRKREIRMKLQ